MKKEHFQSVDIPVCGFDVVFVAGLAVVENRSSSV